MPEQEKRGFSAPGLLNALIVLVSTCDGVTSHWDGVNLSEAQLADPHAVLQGETVEAVDIY